MNVNQGSIKNNKPSEFNYALDLISLTKSVLKCFIKMENISKKIFLIRSQERLEKILFLFLGARG